MSKAGKPPPTPPAPESLYEYVVLIYQNQEKIMSGLTDLQAAVTALVAEITTAVAEIQTLNANGSEDAAVETQAQAILAATTTLTTAVSGAATPPVTPAPASSSFRSGTGPKGL
jgi:hypothetical protein